MRQQMVVMAVGPPSNLIALVTQQTRARTNFPAPAHAAVAVSALLINNF